MKKLSLVMALSFAVQPCLATDEFTLYLVRHAEKQGISQILL
jgi:hypothetical protein